MSSVFSFLRLPPSGTPPELPEGAATPPAARDAAPVSSLDQVPAVMLAKLQQYLPAPGTGQPFPQVTIISVNEAPIGIGNYVGIERRGPLSEVEVRGGRLDAVVRYQLWGANADEVNTSILTLQGRLLAARDALWSEGFLRVTSETSSTPLFDSGQNIWGRTADYRILFEYTYDYIDAAQSLIARIPIHSDLEVLNSLPRETSVVTDEMARWDNLSAPPLVRRGRHTIRGLTALAYISPVAPAGPVTLTRTFDGNINPLLHFPTLAEFLVAITRETAPERSARITFGSLAVFLAALGEIGSAQPFGDWDENGDPDQYHTYGLAFDPPVHLPLAVDRFEIVYGNGEEPFDQIAVVYLRTRAP